VADEVVINTGPLLALERCGALDVIARLPLAFVSTREVHDELTAGAEAGHAVIVPECVHFHALSDPIDAMLLVELDLGEASVIALAQARGTTNVCIDERKGRLVASALGLSVVGTLGLLGRAKKLGLISEVRPYIARLQASPSWFNRSLLARFLAELGE
jgi:predicted nucleic acid-binding protein